MEARVGQFGGRVLQPRMPRRIHSAQIVVTVRCSNQRADFTIGTVEIRQGVQPGDDRGDRTSNHCY